MVCTKGVHCYLFDWFACFVYYTPTLVLIQNSPHIQLTFRSPQPFPPPFSCSFDSGRVLSLLMLLLEKVVAGGRTSFSSLPSLLSSPCSGSTADVAAAAAAGGAAVAAVGLSPSSHVRE